MEGRPQGKATAQVMAVQTSSALLSGLTAATLTNPLDVIKTRLQVLILPAPPSGLPGAAPSWRFPVCILDNS